jgi:hypothetical protein
MPQAIIAKPFLLLANERGGWAKGIGGARATGVAGGGRSGRGESGPGVATIEFYCVKKELAFRF